MLLTKIQNELLTEHPELGDKRTIFEYYVDFQFPEKQRKLAHWWEAIIDLAIRKSGEVYLSPSDIEIIFTIHGLKPIPLQKVLSYLDDNGIIEWEGKKTAQLKNEQSSGWFGAIANYVWKPNHGKQITSGFKSLQSEHDSKIIFFKYKNELLSKIKQVLEQELRDNMSIPYHHIFSRLNQQLPISSKSIEFLLQDTKNKNYIAIEEIQGKKIIFYSSLDKINDKKWLEIQKSKYTLRTALQVFDKKIESRMKEQSIKLKSAKQYVEHDKNQTKRILGQVRAMKKTTDQLENRRRLLKQTLQQLQLNESDSLIVDIMGECQKVIQKTMVQGNLIEGIKDKHMQIVINQKQVNEQIESMANMNSKQIEDEVDDMMAELQKEIKKNHNEKSQIFTYQNQQHKEDVQFNLN